MPVKEVFTAEEWARVVRAPMLASLAVTAADPGGLVGAVQEAAAASRAMFEAREETAGLASEVVGAFEDGEQRKSVRDHAADIARGRKPEEISAAAIVEIGDTVALVRAKAPAEAAAFTGWLKELAARVADAAREGGFLGFGGERVSDAERRALAELDAALDPDGG